MNDLNRAEEISNLLLMVGADTSSATIKMIDRFIDFIPTSYLENFTEYIVDNYSQYKKPIVNITSSASAFRAKLTLVQIQRNEFGFNDADDTRDFILRNFDNKEIANDLTNLYKNFVTIALVNGKLKNLYANLYLDSKETNEFWIYIHYHQNKIGDIKIIQDGDFDKFVSYFQNLKEVEAQKEIEKNQSINERVLEMFNSIKEVR